MVRDHPEVPKRARNAVLEWSWQLQVAVRGTYSPVAVREGLRVPSERLSLERASRLRSVRSVAGPCTSSATPFGRSACEAGSAHVSPGAARAFTSAYLDVGSGAAATCAGCSDQAARRAGSITCTGACPLASGSGACSPASGDPRRCSRGRPSGLGSSCAGARGTPRARHAPRHHLSPFAPAARALSARGRRPLRCARSAGRRGHGISLPAHHARCPLRPR
jgi:hypothetical protein